MPHPYDASTKYLLQNRLADWLPLTGHASTAELRVIDADLSTVTAAADRVLQVCEAQPWLLHVELQSSRDSDLLPNLPVYNVLLARQHGLLVRTVVVQLRKSADWPEMTGEFTRGFPNERPYLEFRYDIVRVWQLPPEAFLNGGLGILPLAPLSAVAEAELPRVIRRMDERIRAEAGDDAGKLWTAADVLMGLKYPRQIVGQLLRGVHGMRDSDTYQAIVEEGMVRARQNDLLRQGRRRFGSPSVEMESALQDISDPDRLSRMLDALQESASWEELIATP